MPQVFRFAGLAMKQRFSCHRARWEVEDITARPRQATIEEMGMRNVNWFDTEIEKLEHWAEDRSATFKAELDQLDEFLKLAAKRPQSAYATGKTGTTT